MRKFKIPKSEKDATYRYSQHTLYEYRDKHAACTGIFAPVIKLAGIYTIADRRHISVIGVSFEK